MTSVFALAVDARARISFLQRLRAVVIARPQPKVERPAAAVQQTMAEPAKAPEVMRNIKWTHDAAYDYAQLGGMS